MQQWRTYAEVRRDDGTSAAAATQSFRDGVSHSAFGTPTAGYAALLPMTKCRIKEITAKINSR